MKGWELYIVLCVLVVSLVSAVRCDNLPDAPSTVKLRTNHGDITVRVYRTSGTRCGPRWLGGCWDYNHPNLTVGQTFRSPWFFSTVGSSEAAYWADVGFSLKAIHRGCVEGNPDLPAHPVLGDYAANWAKTELPMDILMWGFVKLNRRPTNVMVSLIAGARVGMHMHGVAAAWGCGR